MNIDTNFTKPSLFRRHMLAALISTMASGASAQNADDGAASPILEKPLTQTERPQIDIDTSNLITSEPPDTNGLGSQARDILGHRSDRSITIKVPEFAIVGRTPLTNVVVEVPEFIIIGKDPDKEEIDTQNPSRLSDIGVVPKSRDLSAPAQPPQQDATLGFQPMCHGDYSAFFGRGKGTAVGFAMPLGKHVEVSARVEALDCGKAIYVTIRGQNILMSGDLESRSYSGSFNMGDGAARTLVLVCDQDLSLRGYLTASDQNLAIQRPVWMIGNGVAQFDLTTCPAQD